MRAIWAFPTKWCNSCLHVQSRLLLRQMACIGINCERPYHWLKLLVLVCSPGDPPASQMQLVVSVANKMVLFPTQSIEGFSNNEKFKDELCKWTMKLLHIILSRTGHVFDGFIKIILYTIRQHNMSKKSNFSFKEVTFIRPLFQNSSPNIIKH